MIFAVLVFVAFIPYPTSLIAEHYHDDGLGAATILYTLTLAGAALCTDILWFHATRGRRLVAENADPTRIKKLTRQIIPGAPLSFAGALIAIWNPRVTLALVAAAMVFYMVSGESLSFHAVEARSS